MTAPLSAELFPIGMLKDNQRKKRKASFRRHAQAKF